MGKTANAELFEIVAEIEEGIDEYFWKLAPNPLQLKCTGKLVKFYGGKGVGMVYGTVVSGYLNDIDHSYIFSAFHIVTVDGRSVTVDAKDVIFVRR